MLEKEIGSNFCETIEKSQKCIRDSQELFFFDSGRSAINFVLDRMQGENLRVLLPLYTCESVIKPFVTHGCDIRYYRVDKKLEIIKDEFTSLVESFKPDLIYIHSYFGFDTLSKMKEIINQLRKKDIIIVEDITHSMFSDIEHVDADFYGGSLRKWCSLPDGGVLKVASKRAINIANERNCRPENTEFVEKRLKAQFMKERYFFEGKDTEKEFIGWFDASEEILEQQEEIFTMSQYSRCRIDSIDWDELKKVRYNNYRLLVEKLNSISEIEPVMSDIAENIVPLYLPIYVGAQRNELRVFARERNVMLPVIWPIPVMAEQTLDAETEWIYNHILAIPCDQRYMDKDMEKVVDTIRIFFAERQGKE